MINRYPLVLVAVRNGLIGGTLGFVLLIGLYYLGRHPFLIPVFMDFRVVLFAVLFFFSLRELRDYYQQGTLLFWQGMVTCLLFTSVFAVLASLLVWAFAAWNHEFVSSYITQTMDQLKSIPADVVERIGKATYEENVQRLPSTTPRDLALLYSWQCFVISFFISIIISVILRRQPKI